MGASIALALCDGSRKAIMYGTGSSSPTRPPQLPPATGHVPSACPKRIALGRLRRYGANDCLHQDKSIPLSAVQHHAVSHGLICASRATAIDPNFVARFPAHDGPVSARLAHYLVSGRISPHPTNSGRLTFSAASGLLISAAHP